MKQPKPFYRKQTKSYYVQLGKQQINLGPNRERAWEEYCGLMAGRQVLEKTSTAATVLLQFLAWSSKHNKPGTHAFYKRHCVSFVESVGVQIKVADLKRHHVTTWIDESYPGTSDNYRRGAIRSVQRALNWAVEEEHLTYNPLAKVKKPKATPRDVILTPDQWTQLVAKLTDGKNGEGKALLQLLTFMRQTGCRPQEARTVKARHVDTKNKCVVFERVESKGQFERRVIPLTDEAFALCQANSKLYPTGPLFRNSHGTPWKKHALKERMLKLGRKLGFRLYAYAIRHTWATEAIVNGVDIASISAIMGHKNPTQLLSTYQHVGKVNGHLRTALHKALGLATPAATSPA